MLALTPTLQNLAVVLRHREMWPRDFEWSYATCRSCAMGLAWRLGMISSHDTDTAAQEFDIPRNVARRIFIYLNNSFGLAMSDITPERVADEIDAYLAETATTETA
jgi:hypothetical protein